MTPIRSSDRGVHLGTPEPSNDRCFRARMVPPERISQAAACQLSRVPGVKGVETFRRGSRTRKQGLHMRCDIPEREAERAHPLIHLGTLVRSGGHVAENCGDECLGSPLLRLGPGTPVAVTKLR